VGSAESWERLVEKLESALEMSPPPVVEK